MCSTKHYGGKINDMQYVILTVSDNTGAIIYYSATPDVNHKYTDTETFMDSGSLEGISITTYDNYNDFIDALTDYKCCKNCKYIECMYN